MFDGDCVNTLSLLLENKTNDHLENHQNNK